MPKIIHVVGARPNFMKAAPVIAAIADRGRFEQLLVHTGQQYDRKMSRVFFEELGIPEADVNLEVGSGSHAVQTGRIMMRFEEVLLDALLREAKSVLDGRSGKGRIPPPWDGRASKRIADVLENNFHEPRSGCVVRLSR